MAASPFQSLCEGLCELLQVPPIAPSGDDDGPVAFHLNRQGVVIDILHFPRICPEHAFVLFAFGRIPYDDPRAGQILLALLDVNFLLPQPHPPALGRNPGTGEITLRQVVPLAETTASDLRRLIDQGVAIALEWRQGYFLNDGASGELPRADGLFARVGGLA
jgi:hypothetical protein